MKSCIAGFLDTAKANYHLFSRERFEERMREKGQHELLSTLEPLDFPQLDADVQFATREQKPQHETVWPYRVRRPNNRPTAIAGMLLLPLIDRS